ncbi:MAG: type II toxin-antitoxin system RelE/ParE family toxin [Psychrobacillus sp.]
MKKYEIEFYEDKKGQSQIVDWIKELDSNPTKENKSTLKKLYYQMERLEYDGTFIGEPLVKQIKGKIWELRPIPNRVFFATLEDNQLILLHQFRKKSQKTPKREIEQAKRELADWLERKKG